MLIEYFVKGGYRYGYQGQFAEKDLETGWNHFELREYDPIVGRWTTKDPYGQFWSPYVGMGNNPVSGTDPDGGLCCGGEDMDMAYSDAMQQMDMNLYDQIQMSGSTLLSPVTVYPILDNIYSEISNSFNEMKIDYMLAEGIQFNSSFNMIGNYSVRQIDGRYYFNATAAGNTTAETQGDVTFQGKALLMVDGKMVSSTPFTYADGYNVKFPDGFSNLGGLSIQLPTSGIVTINMEFNYHIVFGSAGERHSATMNVPVYTRTIGLPRD